MKSSSHGAIEVAKKSKRVGAVKTRYLYEISGFNGNLFDIVPDNPTRPAHHIMKPRTACIPEISIPNNVYFNSSRSKLEIWRNYEVTLDGRTISLGDGEEVAAEGGV